MIIRSALMLALLALVVPPAMAQAPRRQLEAHTHGEGRLAIAIEGNRVQMELEAPASDIVGFEHAPRTATQRKTLAEAKERLAKAETLFVLSAAAGCRLASAEVAAVGALAGAGTAHKHGDHDHAKDEKGKASAKGADKGDGEGAHSEVRDSKVAVFATELPPGVYEYTYLMRASAAGQFRALPTTAYEMYFPETFGRSASALFPVAPVE